MTQKEELLAAFDDVWSHRWESFETTIKDVSAEESLYQDPIYASEIQEAGDPPPGTIIWQAAHLAHCYKDYEERIRIRPEKPKNVEPPPVETLEEGITQIRFYRNKLRDVIASLPDEALEEKVSNGDTVARFVRMITRHDAWHTSQIAIARRLYHFRK